MAGMKSINVEMCMGHNIGISKSYYKPTQKEILDDYLKAVEVLSINSKKDNSLLLQREIDKLKERNEDNEHIIRSKLQERDDSIVVLSDQVMKLIKEVEELRRNR
jgi:hypothetical protein